MASLFIAFVLGLGWLTPFHFPPWISWHAEALVFLAVFMAAWVSIVRLPGQGATARSIELPAIIWPFAVLALLAVVQRFTGLMTFWGDVLVVWFYAALCITCLMLGFAAVPGHTEKRGSDSPVMLLALALVVAGVASTVLALAQTFELWESSPWIARMPDLQRPGGNLSQPNHLATLLLMALASVVFLHESKKLSALPGALLVFVFGLGLAVTGSRAGMLGFFALLAWWLAKRSKIGSQTPPSVAAAVAAGFALLFGLWPRFYALVELSGTAKLRLLDSGGRVQVWPQIVEAILEKPWWGWGIREVARAQNSVVHAYPFSLPFTYSHNLVLDLAIWLGLPLAAILVLAGGVWFWRRAVAANQLLPWYCLAVAIPLAVHSMVEYPFAYAYFLAPAMFLLGIMEATLGVPPVFRLKRPIAVAALFVTSALLLWSAVEYFRIEEDFRVVRFEALHIGQTPAGYKKPDVVLLTQLGALLEGGRITPRPGMSADELLLARNVALHYPWTATQNRYALALALNGQPAEAIRQLRVMRVFYGEKMYQEIKANWQALAKDKYPQLRELQLP